MLTKADKDWIRRAITKALKDVPTLEQVGSYDGATEVKDDLDEHEYNEFRARHRIGFSPVGSDMKT